MNEYKLSRIETIMMSGTAFAGGFSLGLDFTEYHNTKYVLVSSLVICGLGALSMIKLLHSGYKTKKENKEVYVKR